MVASVSEDSNSYGILLVKKEFYTSTWLEACIRQAIDLRSHRNPMQKLDLQSKTSITHCPDVIKCIAVSLLKRSVISYM